MPRKRNVDHCVMRNGQPFCENCGQSYEINLPAPMKVFTASMNAFVDTHRHCEKTWTEPEPPQSGDTRELMISWLAGGERGASSETIFSTLSGYVPGGPPLVLRWGQNEPSDPDDFRRCHLLLEWVPEFRSLLYHMKKVSPVWSNLVDNWDKLTEMLLKQLETGKRDGMYEFMKEIGC